MDSRQLRQEQIQGAMLNLTVQKAAFEAMKEQRGDDFVAVLVVPNEPPMPVLTGDDGIGLKKHWRPLEVLSACPGEVMMAGQVLAELWVEREPQAVVMVSLLPLPDFVDHHLAAIQRAKELMQIIIDGFNLDNTGDQG